MAPEYEDVQNPSPVVPRTDLDADGYLRMQGQHDNEHADQGLASGSGVAAQSNDPCYDDDGYLNPAPGNHDAIESRYLRPPLPDVLQYDDKHYEIDGYLNPNIFPSNQDISVEMTPLSGDTANPYSEAYEHLPLQTRPNTPS